MERDTETRFERVEEDIKKLFVRTDETNRWQGRYGEKIENIEKSISGLMVSMQTLLDKPQKRWDMVVASAISAVVGSVITGSISLVLFKGMM